MSKVVILGCGPVGKYIAIDLCRNPDYEVTSVDISREALDQLTKEHPVKALVEDLSTAKGVTQAASDADIVIDLERFYDSAGKMEIETATN